MILINKKLLFIFIFTACWAGIFSAAEAGEIPVEKWLTLGPLPIPQTLFEDESGAECWVNREFIDLKRIAPAEGDNIDWHPGRRFQWRAFKGAGIEFDSKKAMNPQIIYLAAYIYVNRRGTVSIKAQTTYPGALYVDGKMEAKISVSAVEEAPNLLIADVDLHTGKHSVFLKLIRPGCDSSVPWTVEAAASPQEDHPAGTITLSTSPRRSFTNVADYALIDRVSGLDISSDGNLVAMVVSRRDKDDFKTHSWIEVRSRKDGKLLNQIKGDKSVSQPVLAPGENALYYRTSSEEGTKLWRYKLETGEAEMVLGPIKGLVDLVVTPDQRFAYYTADGERQKRGSEDYTLFTALEERLTDWSDQRRVFIASLEDGAAHQLTAAGDFAVDQFALDAQAEKMAFTRRCPTPGRPYFTTEIHLLDVQSGELKLVFSGKIPFETRPQNLTFIPGGDYLVFTGPSHFTGEDEIDGRLMNLSEVDIYRLNLRTLELKNLTGHTLFTVDERGGSHNSLLWSSRDKRLYFLAMERGFNKLYSLDIHKSSDIKEVRIPHYYIKLFDMSEDGEMVVFTDSKLDQPDRVHAGSLKTLKGSAVFDPNPNIKDSFEFAAYDRWDFTNRLGHKIDGWIFYPPGFDQAEKYPMIVYYYAGVWMLDESFYFMYHFWAANGYVVYALTPVGAMAHGDDFSAYHVNDWGEYATQDIIEGVEKLVGEKEFIDVERIGCYGASYGGFTTMDLVSKTDLFAAAVSMYGISNIASYWGGGIWGYTYGDIALTKSSPWNRKDVFVEKSPLFNADRITTPLLLLHGDKDVNVPEMESQQMFTALKTLDKDVSFVSFKGEGHGITGKFQNYIAHREMMLEWFDKYLKDQPEGWERRWKKDGN